MEQAVGTFGRIDVLHHNVGVGMGDSTPTKLSEEAWDRILDVNLKRMWLTCKEVVPVMRKQQSGSIVCVSSIAAVVSTGFLTAYKISKAGVNTLVHALAVTNANHGIRVNGIMPGLIDTPMAVDAVAAALDMSQRRSGSAARRDRPIEQTAGIGVGRCQCSAVSRLGRSGVHHGRRPARRWGTAPRSADYEVERGSGNPGTPGSDSISSEFNVNATMWYCPMTMQISISCWLS